MADALQYVHGLNRLHLDIKPGNIMLTKEGKAILIDFGASKHYDDETGENTSTLLGINTKGYAPVEQVNQSFKSCSPATDIYALGATLYKLLTGVTPPPSTSLNAEEETLLPLPLSISPNTRKAVESAMQLLRKNRPQSVGEWKNLLINDEATIVEILENPKSDYDTNAKSGKKSLDNDSRPLSLHKNQWIIICIAVVLLIVSVIMTLITNGRMRRNEDWPVDSDSVAVVDYIEADSVAVDTAPADYYYYDDGSKTICE